MLDRPHYEKGKDLSFHINYDADKPIFLKKYLNHKEISESTCIRFKNFTKVGKAVRIRGKVLLVVSVLLDTLELGNTIIDDLSDVDKKIGKNRYDSSKDRKSLDMSCHWGKTWSYGMIWNCNRCWRYSTWFSWRYCRSISWRRLCKLGI